MQMTETLGIFHYMAILLCPLIWPLLKNTKLHVNGCYFGIWVPVDEILTSSSYHPT